MEEHGAIAGVQLAGRDWQRIWGDPTVRVVPESDAHHRAAAGKLHAGEPGGEPIAGRDRARARATGARVLDLFCGAGNLSLPLARAGSEVIGVDASATAVGGCAAKRGPGGARPGALRGAAGPSGSFASRVSPAPTSSSSTRRGPAPRRRSASSRSYGRGASSTCRATRPPSRVTRGARRGRVHRRSRATDSISFRRRQHVETVLEARCRY